MGRSTMNPTQKSAQLCRSTIAAVLCLAVLQSATLAKAVSEPADGRGHSFRGSEAVVPASSKEAFVTARALMISGSLDQALSAYTKVIADFPKSTEALRAREMIAVLQERLGKTDDAVSSWMMLMERASDTAAADRAVKNVARLWSSKSQQAKGVVALRSLASRHPGTPLWSICTKEAGRLVCAGGDSTAISSYWLSAARNVDVRSVPLLVEAAVSVYSDSHAYGPGAKILQMLAGDHLGGQLYGAAMVEAGKLLDISGDSNGALAAYRKSVDGSPSTEYGSNAVIFVKNIRLSLGSPAEVLDELRRLSARHRGTRAGARAIVCQGEILTAVGDVDSAKRVLVGLRSQCPKSWDESRDGDDLLSRLQGRRVR